MESAPERGSLGFGNNQGIAVFLELGYLAYIVGDVAQPMHADSSDKVDGVHSSYEQAVDRRIPIVLHGNPTSSRPGPAG